jgi:hypothetical protein
MHELIPGASRFGRVRCITNFFPIRDAGNPLRGFRLAPPTILPAR